MMGGLTIKRIVGQRSTKEFYLKNSLNYCCQHRNSRPSASTKNELAPLAAIIYCGWAQTLILNSIRRRPAAKWPRLNKADLQQRWARAKFISIEAN
jgi:hypothetical protein